MQEIVVNRCYGGFGLSTKAQNEYAKRKGFKLYYYEQTKWNFKDKTTEYIRVKEPKHFSYTLKKDLGKKINILGVDATDWFHESDIKRDDPDLVSIVKNLKEEANGSFAELEVVEIPDNVEWEIEEYDGQEWVSEVHQTW